MKAKISINLNGQQMLDRIMADPRNSSAIANIVQKQLQPRVVSRVNLHYKAMLRRLLELVANGVDTVEMSQGGVARITAQTPSGRVFIRSQRWAGLDPFYQIQRPYSQRFWQKRGKLQAAILGINGGEARMVQAKSRTAKNKVTMASTLAFGTLPPPLDQLMLLSFVTGDENSSNTGSFSASDFAGGFAGLRNEVLRKNARPFIRRLAARMGQEMRKDLLLNGLKD